jgi:hypothetical protein
MSCSVANKTTQRKSIPTANQPSIAKAHASRHRHWSGLLWCNITGSALLRPLSRHSRYIQFRAQYRGRGSSPSEASREQSPIRKYRQLSLDDADNRRRQPRMGRENKMKLLRRTAAFLHTPASRAGFDRPRDGSLASWFRQLIECRAQPGGGHHFHSLWQHRTFKLGLSNAEHCRRYTARMCRSVVAARDKLRP